MFLNYDKTQLLSLRCANKLGILQRKIAQTLQLPFKLIRQQHRRGTKIAILWLRKIY